jgi:hypothetical protein
MERWAEQDETCAEILEKTTMAANEEHNGVVKMKVELEVVQAVIKDELKPLVTIVAVHHVKIAAISWIGGVLAAGLIGAYLEHIFK